MKKDPKGRGDDADPLEEATRLLDQGQATAALQYLVPLHEKYSDDPEIAIALGLASLKTNRVARACQIFSRFVARWPRHRKTAQIQRAYDDLAPARKLRLDFLGMHDEDIDVAVAYEESNAFLNAGQFAEARHITEVVLESRPRCAPARNNLSYLLWLDGDADGAREQAERVLQDDPDNLQALCHLVRYRLLGGDVEGAKALGERLRELPNTTSDSAVMKMEALSFLPDDRAVVSLYEQAVSSGNGVEQDGSSPMLHHLGAAAHARLGNESAARSLWQQALRVTPDFELAKSNLDDARARPADRHGAWPFSLSNWVSARDLGALQQALQDGGGPGLGAAMRAWLAPRAGAVELVRRLLQRGDAIGRDFALMLATHAQTPEMNGLLRDFALGPDGPDALRASAFRTVVERGLLPRGPVRVWRRGEHRFTLPQAHDLADEGKLEPTVRQLLTDLENSAPLERIEAGVEAVGEEFPIGRIGRARLQLARGEKAAAAETLDTLLDRPRLTRTELAALCEAQVMLAEETEARDLARGWLDVWAQVRSDSPAVARWRKRLA